MADVLKKQMEIKVGKIEGTTSSNGMLATDIDFDSIILLSSWGSSGNCATPSKTSSDGKLAFRLTSTSGGNWTVVANQNRTAYYSYIDRPLPTYS